MADLFRLARSYLQSRPLLSTTLILAAAVSIALPVVTNHIVSQYEKQLALRSENPPLLVGARGSRYDLVLKTLYFLGDIDRQIVYGDYQDLAEANDLLCVPLHVIHTASRKEMPVVGTTSEYFSTRNIPIAVGQPFAQIGHCVVGSNIGSVGERIKTDRLNPFDLNAPSSVSLEVVGVLAPTNSPDDDAVFVSLETAWLLDGYGHGHTDDDTGTAVDQSSVLADSTDGHRPADPVTVIDGSNRHQIHSHGKRDQYKLSAVSVWPQTQKAGVLAEGRYLEHPVLQMLLPGTEFQQLIEYVFRIKSVLDTVFIVMLVLTCVLITVIGIQTVHLRSEHLRTMKMLGCARSRVVSLLCVECSLLLCGVLLAAAGMALVLIVLSPSLVMLF